MASDSIWLKEHKSKYSELEDDIECDVAVVGGGISGISCAYNLTKAGKSTVVLEATVLGRGTTGHSTAHLTSQHNIIYSEIVKGFGWNAARLYAKSNEDVIRQVENISKEEHIDCDYEIQNSYLFSIQKDKLQKLKDEISVVEKLDIDMYSTNSDKFILPYLYAMCFKNQAVFHPVKYINGIAEAIVKGGGRIYENSRVLHIDGNKLSTSKGSVTARDIIITTHNPVINFPGWYFAKMYLMRAYVLVLSNAPHLNNMWSSADKHGKSFRMNGEYLLVSGADHKCGTKTNINHYDYLEQFKTQYFPESDITFKWSAQDGITLDGLPYIGQYSKKTPNIYVATGFEEWGLTKSIVASNVISDLILGRENPYAQIYSPSRKQNFLAILNAIYYNLAVLGHYSVGLLGFGRPRCAHMKCRLVYNKAEGTWDCPCHGSRFDKNGSVLDTPAIHDLKRN